MILGGADCYLRLIMWLLSNTANLYLKEQISSLV